MSFDSYLYEVAGWSGCGTLKEVELMPMYEFLDVLEYIRYTQKANNNE
jgi:hypothetical protein